MSEIWKDIVDYEDYYEVSSHGKVRNKKTMHILKPWFCKTTGYFMVSLCVNGTSKHKTVHRLLGIMFIANPLNKAEIDHIDGNRQNNK